MSDEGEDPSPRPKRKIKKVMVLSSASNSDSDDSGPTTSTRRKRLRVLSEDGEVSDSSSGSWAMGAIRRRRALPGLRDSEGDSDSSGWATDHSDAPGSSSAPCLSSTSLKSPSNKAAKPVSGFCSDSSEGNSEKCSICLMKFLNQEVGTPQNCEHIFCLDCITEWSKNMNTCPVDRITFESIVVRACAGGRVLRTEVVKVAERRSSLEMMIIEDPTVCEVCHNADREESMLLCDGCDHGFHMQCLTPPLTRIPEDQWLCTYCAGVWRSAAVEITDGRYRSNRELDEPSTSSGRRPTRRTGPTAASASASRPSPAPAASASRAERALGGANAYTRRAATATGSRTRKRKYKRRTRAKKRKTKRRQPRTAARRTHVLASVRAKLASVRRHEGAAPSLGTGDTLAVRRAGAGIPTLSLFGSDHQLDFFEEEEAEGSESASTAVARATRPTSTILSAYRQARRKMIRVPSPSHASSAPDLLSDILESQALLHSKGSIVSVTVDGNVNIKLERRGARRKEAEPVKRSDPPLGEKQAVDLTKEEGTRQAPSYPGQGRGWGGGYRYPRDQTNHHQSQGHNQAGNQGYGRGGYDNGFGGVPRAAAGAFDRRDDNNGHLNHYDNRRPNHYAIDDESWHDRNRRQPDQNRVPNNQRNEDRRFSGAGPAWRPNRSVGPPQRQSFGGFENPLDMRMGQEPALPGPGYSRGPSFPEQDKPQPYRPLPLPPSFELVEVVPPRLEDRDEDERSDEGLVIDTEKYDPTEPTNDDDDSGEEEDAVPPCPPPAQPERDPSPRPPPPPPLPPPPLPLDAASVESILAGISSSGLNVPADILDSAVRQALEEHRALLAPSARLDEGDCPNFSIYSATSVHIATDSGRVAPDEPPERRNSLEDLVQEDGELTPPPAQLSAPSSPPAPAPSSPPATALLEVPEPPAPEESTASHVSAERSLQEYKAKVSKRCPITTNTRNPIKIRLHTPALIKRHVALYDDDDDDDDVERDADPSETSVELAPDEGEPAPDETEPALDEAEPGDEENVPRKLEFQATDEASDPKEPEPEEETSTPHITDEEATPDRVDELDGKQEEQLDDDRTDDELDDKDKNESESEESASSRAPSGAGVVGAKMTESISETEDERSYTPCLDEHKDAPPPDKDIEGLGTELISEEEAQDMFSEGSPAAPAAPPEDGEILDKRSKDDTKKKRRKDGRKEGRSKGRKRSDVAFKKLSKGKERNYRARDKDKPKRRSSSSSAARSRSRSRSRSRRRRKDKRKDLERYDVRTLVSERRRRAKDAFGRDVSPSASSPEPPPPHPPPRRASSSPEPRRRRASARPSPSPPRRGPRFSPSPPPRRRASSSPPRRPRRLSPSPLPRRRSSPSVASPRRSPSPVKRRRKRSADRPKAARRRSSASKARKRRRETVVAAAAATAAAEPATPKPAKKKKKRARSPRAGSPVGAAGAVRRRSPRRKRARRRSSPPAIAMATAAGGAWSPPRALSPRTPPPAAPVPLEERRRRRDVERAHRRLRESVGPCKEVFTSGDNILVSVSFAEQARAEGQGGLERRARRLSRRRRRAAAPDAGSKPVAIIDLERSPFRELTPSPKHVIVLSDDEADASSAAPAPAPAEAVPAAALPPQLQQQAQGGPKTPPDPAGAATTAPPSAPEPAPEGAETRGPLTPPEPPDSPDAYDPYEPTRSASASPPAPAAASPPCLASPPAHVAHPAPLDRPSMTLEAAQKTNLSADEVLDRRPLSPIEKVLALLQSTRDESPEAVVARAAGAPPPGAPPSPPAALTTAPRVLLPDAPPRAPPKLFLAKPSPIKSDPIKPMPQASKVSRLPLPAVVTGVRRRSASPGGGAAGGGASPYSPGSSDFECLFEPPAPHPYKRSHKRNGKSKRGNRGKTTVDVKLGDDNLKILDELPSSAVEMQVKSKFLKKLNRQERVVEEVKLVLKPHYNKKHVSKEEYKHILRRAVPKICHNKTGEINPIKIQSLVEAYVKKFRKKRKLGQ